MRSATRTRLKRLQAAIMAKAVRNEDEHDPKTAKLIQAWEKGECVGPLPPSGLCPTLYLDRPSEWRAIHRLFCGMILREKGLALPDDFTQVERRDIEDSIDQTQRRPKEGAAAAVAPPAELAIHQMPVAELLAEKTTSPIGSPSPPRPAASAPASQVVVPRPMIFKI